MFHISVFVNSRDKPRAHESLQYAVPTWNNQIHSLLKKKEKTIMGIDGSDSCSMWIYLRPLNCTLINDKFYVHFNTIKKKKLN